MSLPSLVESCTNALAAITPQTLTPEHLDSSLEILNNVDIDTAIDKYWTELPTSPEQDNEIPEWQNQIHEKARELNKRVTGLNNELSRIKEMQAALKIPQLEEVIRAGQRVVRPLYNFTAQLNN